MSWECVIRRFRKRFMGSDESICNNYCSCSCDDCCCPYCPKFNFRIRVIDGEDIIEDHLLDMDCDMEQLTTFTTDLMYNYISNKGSYIYVAREYRNKRVEVIYKKKIGIHNLNTTELF